MSDDLFNDDEPCYVISVAARMVELHPQRLRYYDRIGLLRPSRTAGRVRLYSQRDVEMLRKIARLTEDLGVNLAGVEVILNMRTRMEEIESQVGQFLDFIRREFFQGREEEFDARKNALVRTSPSRIVKINKTER